MAQKRWFLDFSNFFKKSVDGLQLWCYNTSCRQRDDKNLKNMRKCWNWQTGQTKDLVVIAIVWVQVPSSAEWEPLCMQGFFPSQKNQRKFFFGSPLIFIFPFFRIFSAIFILTDSVLQSSVYSLPLPVLWRYDSCDRCRMPPLWCGALLQHFCSLWRTGCGPVWWRFRSRLQSPGKRVPARLVYPAEERIQ